MEIGLQWIYDDSATLHHLPRRFLLSRDRRGNRQYSPPPGPDRGFPSRSNMLWTTSLQRRLAHRGASDRGTYDPRLRKNGWGYRHPFGLVRAHAQAWLSGVISGRTQLAAACTGSGKPSL